ncbi:MAG TPA: hypothetical protein VKY73_17630 [Polyangiaceae bacterium]|nr:hypothetical protein [Polyangiaceae bacterium]
MDAARLLVLAGAVGVLVCAHVVLLVRLASVRPRWQALAAFFVPPLAPFWGWKRGLRAASVVWIASAIAYAGAFAAASV